MKDKKMQVQPLHRRWNLAIRHLIRQEFVDRHPTEKVAWDRGCVVLRDETPRVVGACLVDADGYLRYLVVREGFRKQGWGKAMLKFCAMQITYLDCASHLCAFYASNGFEEIPSEPTGPIRMVRKD